MKPGQTATAHDLETYRGVVYPWHMDQMGHMNVQFYTARFDEATWHLFASLGVTPGFLEQHRRGMAAVDQHTRYLRELRAGALIRITSQVLELREKSVRFLHRMHDVEADEVAATSELVGVFIDTDARRGVAFPPEIARRIRAAIEPQARAGADA